MGSVLEEPQREIKHNAVHLLTEGKVRAHRPGFGQGSAALRRLTKM